MEQWERELERLAGSVRPDGSPVGVVRDAVRRRLRRRRALGIASAAAGVVAVLAVTAVLPPGGSPAAVAPSGPTPTGSTTPTGPSDPAPTTSPAPTPGEVADLPPGEPYAGPSIDWRSYELATSTGCGSGGAFGRRPPLADLAEQQELAAQVEGRSGNGYVVRMARPSAIGVIAMIDGDLAAAYDDLPRAVTLSKWFSPEESYFIALEEFVRPTLRALPNELNQPGLAGKVGVVQWQEAGAVVVQWKAPVPPEVLALTGPRADGTVVLVEPTRFDKAELRTASAVVRQGLDAGFVNVYPCGDFSGLEVMLEGSDPRNDGIDTDALEAELTDLAGVPVSVSMAYSSFWPELAGRVRTCCCQTATSSARSTPVASRSTPGSRGCCSRRRSTCASTGSSGSSRTTATRTSTRRPTSPT